jgi:hypothetical protein
MAPVPWRLPDFRNRGADYFADEWAIVRDRRGR